MMSFRAYLASSLLCLPLVLPVLAGDESKLVERRPPDREPTTDQEFLTRAISHEVAEVKFAEKAEKNASHEEVRRLAQKMAEGHQKIRDDFLEQARKMKLAVVEGLEPAHREQYDRLSKFEGAAFDREYLRHLGEGHEKALKLYKKWAKDARDADLRAAAANAATRVENHLDQVKKIKDKIRE